MKLKTEANQLVVSNSGLGAAIFGALGVLAGLGIIIIALATSPKLAVVGVFFAIIGFVFMYLGQSLRVTLSPGGQSEILTKRIVFGSPKVKTFATSEITAVELLSGMNYSQQNGSQRNSTMYLVMKDGSKLELAQAGQGGFAVNGINLASFGKAPLANEANQVASFLQVPVQAADFSNIAQTVKTFMGGMANGDFKGKSPKQAAEEMIQLQQTTTQPRTSVPSAPTSVAVGTAPQAEQNTENRTL
jgi:hypothetical protein